MCLVWYDNFGSKWIFVYIPQQSDQLAGVFQVRLPIAEPELPLNINDD